MFKQQSLVRFKTFLVSKEIYNHDENASQTTPKYRI